jgi:transposase
MEASGNDYIKELGHKAAVMTAQQLAKEKKKRNAVAFLKRSSKRFYARHSSMPG